MRDLEDCRKEIDEIDAEIVKLFERRMNVSHDIALYKQAHYMDILNPAREDAVLRSRAHQAASPELAQSVMSTFGEIMRLSREEQRRYLEARTTGNPTHCVQRCAGRIQRKRGRRFLRRGMRTGELQNV